MARYRSRSRSRSYSPRRRSRTPPRGRKRYDDDPRDRYHDERSRRDRRSPAPSGLLIRNLPLDARPEDLRIPFERFGQVKDVYLPKNYYTGEPRGFGFVKFRYAEDAAEAKQRMNHQVIGGREIRIVFAEENRKTPHEMRRTSRMSDRYGGSYRRTPPRSPRRRYRSYSRSPSPTRHDSRGREMRDDYRSPRRSRSVSRDCTVKGDYRSHRHFRSASRSYSPRDGKEYRSNYTPSPRGNGGGSHDEREYRSNHRSPSPRGNGRGPHDEMDHVLSRSRSIKGESRSPRSRSRSFSPR